MSFEVKATAIKTSVDEFWRRVKMWLQDSNGTTSMPEAIKTALEIANLECSGDIPENCRQLAVVAVPRVVEEMRKFLALENESFERVGGVPVPAPRFWAAVKNLCQARNGADVASIPSLEPVMDLIEQGVSIEQIGMNIYGRRGEGPFISSNGTVVVALVKQQAEYERQMRTTGESKINPIIPEGWVPPWFAADAAKRGVELKQELAALTRMENPKKYTDPASVEELLRDGAYIQQIERVKHVTREEILEIAKQINVVAKDGPGYHPTQQIVPEPEDDDTEHGTAGDDKDVLRQLVIDTYTGLPADAPRGAADITKLLRQQGYDVKSQQVNGILVHHLRKQRENDSAA